MSTLRFISLSSGSSGNCYFIGDGEVSLLIDAGISLRAVKKRLAEYSIDIECIDYLLVTHDHADHIKHLSSISKKLMKPILATSKLFSSLDKHPFTKGESDKFRVYIDKEIPFCYKGVSITAFDVPHDASENLGYFIDFKGERFTLVTDIGKMTGRVIDFGRISNHLIIESNYDTKMLNSGSYPQYLIDRISGGNGHLSNEEASQAIKNLYHPGIRNIFLCHLSENNNTPILAYNSAMESLSLMGVRVGCDINLYCLPRRDHMGFDL